MKLKRIVLMLSFLAFLSVALGGWFYYVSIRDATLNEAHYQAEVRVEMISRHLASFFSENVKPVKALSRMEALWLALDRKTPGALDAANRLLDIQAEALNLEAGYLMNAKGLTVASSNRRREDSFVGRDFSFRPYFKRAIAGEPATYLALGMASGKRGAYCSHPVYRPGQDAPIGVVVLKVSIEQVEQDRLTEVPETVFVTDPSGLIFIANKRAFLYTLLDRGSPEALTALAATQQFGSGPWAWSGLKDAGGSGLEDASGRRYLVNSSPIDGFAGWQVLHLRDMERLSRQISSPFLRISTLVMGILTACIGGLVLLLYGMASAEIKGRKVAEDALKESEERYRMLYHNTPAMLHSIDTQGRLIHVSDHWLEWTGYTRSEVIGCKLTDFFTKASREYAETRVFPDFFEAGMSRDNPYRFVRKNGEVIDILTSGFGVRDAQGKVQRSIAVSVDVTHRNRDRRALEQATEKLSRHSRRLEELVRKRTAEITSIFEHTPAAIYIKRIDGTYRLVNAYFEHQFGVCAREVVGQRGDGFLPVRVAAQFTANDLRAIKEKKACQVREQIPGPAGELTWLSTKFPFYGEDGSVTGVCSVSIDMTELQKTQDTLRNLSGNIMESQERERAAIARELHDHLGQVLTVLRMDAVWLGKRATGVDEEACQRAASMDQLIHKTIQDVRGMAYRLRPAMLDDLGLVAALDALAIDFEKRTGVACLYGHTGAYKDHPRISTAVYRIVQEALTNVARHSGAPRVDVTLAVSDEGLEVSIADKGRGFDPAKTPEGRFGLVGMRERVALVGGVLHIDSGVGDGTTVRCAIPFPIPLAGDERTKGGHH